MNNQIETVLIVSGGTDIENDDTHAGLVPRDALHQLLLEAASLNRQDPDGTARELGKTGVVAGND